MPSVWSHIVYSLFIIIILILYPFSHLHWKPFWHVCIVHVTHCVPLIFHHLIVLLMLWPLPIALIHTSHLLFSVLYMPERDHDRWNIALEQEVIFWCVFQMQCNHSTINSCVHIITFITPNGLTIVCNQLAITASFTGRWILHAS